MKRSFLLLYLKATTHWPQMRAGVGTILLNELYTQGRESAQAILGRPLSDGEIQTTLRTANTVHGRYGIARHIEASDACADWDKTRLFLIGMIGSVPGGVFFDQSRVGLVLREAAEWLDRASIQSHELQVSHVLAQTTSMGRAGSDMSKAITSYEGSHAQRRAPFDVRVSLARDLETELNGRHDLALVAWLVRPFVPILQ